jgi:methionine-rich copper-binding protein CopC
MTMTTRTVRTAALVAAALTLGLPAVASAHAFLDHAEPKVGSTVEASPPRVALHFTQEIEPAFSTVHVLDGAGKQVDQADAAVDPKDQTTMTVGVPKLAAGTYKVEWKVTSVDTHRTHGSFEFTVQPKG